MNFIASKIYTLEEDKDLSPGKGIIGQGAQHIKALHCITQPHAEVVIRTLGGQVVKFPPDSFVPGAIYPYSIIQINKVGADCFLGLSD